MTLGSKIKELRESSGLLQRELASRLDLGEGYLSKVENDQKQLNREHLKTLSEIFKEPLEEFEKLWLAVKLYNILEDEDQALEALKVAEEHIQYLKNDESRK
jgi:transcriptional regulator with XRE-family HTH domain